MLHVVYWHCATMRNPRRLELRGGDRSGHADTADDSALERTIQRTCADKIPGMGECPPEDSTMREECGRQVLNLHLFLFSFKRPRHPSGM